MLRSNPRLRTKPIEFRPGTDAMACCALALRSSSRKHPRRYTSRCDSGCLIRARSPVLSQLQHKPLIRRSRSKDSETGQRLTSRQTSFRLPVFERSESRVSAHLAAAEAAQGGQGQHRRCRLTTFIQHSSLRAFETRRNREKLGRAERGSRCPQTYVRYGVVSLQVQATAQY